MNHKALASAFVLLLLVLCSFVVLGQPQSVTSMNTVTMHVVNTLTVSGGINVQFDVNPGSQYTIHTDGGATPPLQDGTQSVDPLVWHIDGAPGSRVTVIFNLPMNFQSISTGVSIPMTYGPADGLFDNSGTGDGLSGTAFNPMMTYNDFLGADGRADVYLAYNFFVPTNAPAADDYVATFALTCAVTGF